MTMPLLKLKQPFEWENRQILIQDRVFYVPDGYNQFDQFKFPGWTHPDTFLEERPICLEYCSGNGDWIAEKAKQHPEFNWVGIDKKFERTKKIWSKIKRFDLKNLLAVCGEGFRITQHYIEPNSVHAVFINFPDPWPKKRHHKHRIIQTPFIQEIYRILNSGGTLTFVTDDQEYSEFMLEQMAQVQGFVSVFPNPGYTTDYPGYGNSFFESLWRQQGKCIRYHVFKKEE